MEKIFESIFSSGEVNVTSFIIVLLVSLVIGIIFSLVTKIKSESSNSFIVATAILPACVSMVIMLVNGNIGAGVAVAGAFSLVRFRSAQGSAKEICIIFIGMTIGLALGMGYIAYGIIFAIIAILALVIFNNTHFLEKKVDNNEKHLVILVPENLDYNKEFHDTFLKYTSNYKLLKIKSVNMGSMFKLSYDIKLNNAEQEKEFIDDLRTHNGNLEIVLEAKGYEEKDL